MYAANMFSILIDLIAIPEIERLRVGLSQTDEKFYRCVQILLILCWIDVDFVMHLFCFHNNFILDLL